MKMSFLAALTGAAVMFASAAQADCYDAFGCTDRNRFSFEQLANGPNCEFLYEMRNRIYAEHGYCFKTARAISTFGNDGCQYSDVSMVPLSNLERGNATTILQVEHAKGCSE
jgi:hypothetical protein